MGNPMMKRILAAALGLALIAGAAQAQIPGNFPAGTVFGNSSAGTRPGRVETFNAMLNRVLCSTQGAIPSVVTSAWGCLTPGTAGLPLVSGGAGANLSYSALTGAGIASNTVANSNLATMANATFKCRFTGGTGAPEDCTATQATSLLNNFVGDSGAGGTKGLVPAPAAGDAAANKFLKANGAWAAGGTVTSVICNGGATTITTSGTCASREVLSGNRTYFVRTDGSDSNTGLVDSAGGAFLTIQKAIDTAVGLDLANFAVTITVRSGTYTGANTLKRYVGAGPITITGDTGTPSNVLISVTSNNSFNCISCGSWTLEGMKTATITSGFHLNIQGASAVTIGTWDFGTTGGSGSSQVFAFTGAIVNLTANYSISAIGTSGIHLNSSVNAVIQYNSAITVTGASSLAFGTFAIADRQGSILTNAVPTYSGFASVTGTRFTVQNLSFMYTNGSGVNFFPGNAAGSGTNPSVTPWGLYQ